MGLGLGQGLSILTISDLTSDATPAGTNEVPWQATAAGALGKSTMAQLVQTIPANSITLADSADTTAFPIFAGGATGDEALLTDASNLTYNANTGEFSCATLTATNVGGTLSTAAQANITSVGTLTVLALSGSVTTTDGEFKCTDTATTFPGASSGILGATAAGGANILGEGTTNDVTLGNKSAATALRVLTGTQDVDVVGTFTAGTKTFRIPHPVAEGKDLVHSCIEGPKADLFYPGTIDLVAGSATVNIDNVFGMTAGTFEALCRDIRVFTTNESGWAQVKGSVSGAVLTIQAESSVSDTISWMVVAERKDAKFLASTMTDENGDVILEPDAWVVEDRTIEERQKTVDIPVMEKYTKTIPARLKAEAQLDENGNAIIVMVEIEPERQEQAERQVIETATVTVPDSIQLINGTPTLVSEHEEEQERGKTVTLGVVDEQGNAVVERYIT